MRSHKSLLAIALLVGISSRAGATAEICGNDVDDDGNGVVDEGCYPTLTTGVCESPLSCGDTGMVSWATGSLHYDLPPDIAPKVPFGPGIGFRRFFTSMSTPGTNPTSVNKQPLGPHWQHTYLTYLDRYLGGDSVYRVVLHTSDGRDVIFKYASTTSGWESYTPQVGYHVMSLKRNTASPNQYQVQLLTGETLVYNSIGQITEVWDTLGPTPNKVLITWDNTTNGNPSTVTDANGRRRLLFSYTNSLMTSAQFQTKDSGGTWNTQHTTSYAYTGTVSRDASSGWYVPASSTEWTSALAGSSLANPSSLWLMQEASGSLADSIGSRTITVSGSPTYHASAPGWTRLGIKPTSGTADRGTATISDVNTTSAMLLQYFVTNTNPGNTQTWALNDIGGATTEEAELIHGGGSGKLQAQSGSAKASGNQYSSNSTILVVTKLDRSRSQFVVYEQTAGSTLKPTWTNPASSTSLSVFGDGVAAADARLVYSAFWSGSNAELSDTQVATLMASLVTPGTIPTLTSTTIGGQLAQQYTYSGSYLTAIADGGGNQIAAFSYSSTTNGQVDLIATPRGTIGFEFSSSRTACSGKTALYFNKGNTTSCSVDSDCGTGFLCGGKTSSGTTGTCFLAGRCLTTTTLSGESVITDVVPLGPGGGSCSGACTDVLQYGWTSSSSGLINVATREDPLASYTAATYNTNGLPTTILYGASDASGTSPNRTVYLSYDSVFPGRIAEVRRKSDLDTSASSCSATVTTGCARTIYTYNSDTHVLSTVQETGTTLNSSGSNTAYTNTVTYSFDSKGRVSQILGAVSGIKTTFDYLDGKTDPNLDYFLGDTKSYSDSTNFLEPQIKNYDFWGHAISVQAPDGNYTCSTYDSARGFLSSRRRAMNGQTDCTTTNSLDLITSWARDSWLRLTQLTRPDGSCMFYIYDSSGRLSQTKRRDDCTASSSGDYQTWSYTADSQVSEIDTYNASSTLTAKQPYTYFASRKLQEIVNPVDTSKFTGLVYDAGGNLTEVDGAGSLSKTVYHFDGAPGRDNRVTSEERYKTSSTSDAWSLLYDWLGGQSQVTDGDSKVTGSTRDDLGRLVKITSPDFTNATIHVFDAASRLTTVVEDLGAGAYTHSFVYDYLGRGLSADYQGTCQAGSQPEIQQAYDAVPVSAPCPTGVTCSNLTGRLAYVKVSLMCDSSSDHSLDQETYYSYDKAGRLVEEYIRDDSGRTADHLYTWTKNGALAQVTTPSGAVIGWTFGSGGSNSDTDLIAAMWRTNTSTPVIDTVQWNPYGPLAQYNQENAVSSTAIQTLVTRNLAYRISDVKQKYGSTTLMETAITEDAKGRVTSRVYTNAATGVASSYFLYDQQDRVTCETTDSQSTCPSSGSNIKNNQTGLFTNAGDWNKVLRPVPGSSGGLTNQFDPSGYGTSHQVTMVRQNDGTPAIGDTTFDHDVRGNRKYDDNTSTLTNDRRDYTYDARRNVSNVRGQYYTGSAWHYYDVASAFDGQNRRVFKSFKDETTLTVATWFFYYDAMDRLTEVRYTPDTSASTTYSLFQLFWLGNRLVLYWQTDYPSATTSKRYVGTDETGRPIDMWSWPSSGDAARVWAVNPSAWGVDANKVGPTVYQPMLFAGQYQDTEAVAYENDGATVHRAGVALNGFRTYDPFTGGYLQVDPLADETWSSYVFVESDPVGEADPTGLLECIPGSCPVGTGEDGQNTGGTCSVQCEVSCRVLGGLGCDCSQCGTERPSDGGNGCPTGTYAQNDDGNGCHVSNGCYCVPYTTGPGQPVPTGTGYCTGKPFVNPSTKKGTWACNADCTTQGIVNGQECPNITENSAPKGESDPHRYDYEGDAFRQATYNACIRVPKGCEITGCTKGLCNEKGPLTPGNIGLVLE